MASLGILLFKKDTIIFQKFFQKVKREEQFTAHSMKPVLALYQNQMKMSQQKKVAGQYPSWT